MDSSPEMPIVSYSYPPIWRYRASVLLVIPLMAIAVAVALDYLTRVFSPLFEALE
jgi:hypothetical protein